MEKFFDNLNDYLNDREDRNRDNPNRITRLWIKFVNRYIEN